jgi:microcystin-dependent protein
MCPSDASGNYSLPPGYLATAGTTIQPSEHNPPLEDAAAALTARLMRSGAGGMTGPLKLADGTVAAPALSFSSDGTTGLYKTAKGYGIVIGGVQVAEFTSQGLASGGKPIGEITDFAGSAAPAGYLLCLGQSVLRTDYPALFTAIGITFGAVDGTHFTIPDLRGRVSAGNDGGTPANRLTGATMTPNGATLGAVGGAETQTLTLGQLPAGITSTNPAQNISVVSANALVDASGVLQDFNPVTASGFRAPNNTASLRIQNSSAANAIGVTSTNTGGAAHPIVQATIILNKIIFAGA